VQGAFPLFQPSITSFPILQLCFISFPVLPCLGTTWIISFCLAFSFLSATPISQFRANSQSKKLRICPYAHSSVHQKTSGTCICEQNASHSSYKCLIKSLMLSSVLQFTFMSWPQSHLQLNVGLILILAKKGLSHSRKWK